MSAPIYTADRLLGVLSLAAESTHRFSTADLQLLQRIADASGPALERCRAEERSRAFAALGEGLSAVVTPEAAAQILVDVADQLIGWDACVVNLYDSRTETILQLIAYDVVGGQRAAIPPDPNFLELTPQSRQCLQQGSVLILRENPNPETIIHSFGDEGRASASLMWVAVRGGSGIAALLSIQSYRQRAYSDEDLQLLQVMGNHCGNALERARAQQELRSSEARYRKAITEAGAVAYQRDYATEAFVFVGEGIESLTGYKADEFTTEIWNTCIQDVVVRGPGEGMPHDDVAKKTRQGRFPNWRADVRVKTRSGDERWIADTSIELYDENGVSRGSLGILQDITERKQFEEQLLHSALHDPLTGLANRVLLLDHLEQAIVRSRRRNHFDFAVLFLDLDRFKNVNDSLGHMAGDQLLMEVAKRLLLCVRPGDTVARFAGDEFVLLLEDVHNSTDIAVIADRVLQEMGHSVTLEGQDVFPSASVGVVFGSSAYTAPEQLLRDADNALYRAKASGKGGYEIFNPTMHTVAVARLSLETDLRRAMERNELVLHYQPIVHLGTGMISHFEALLRWQHHDKGLIAPGDFIPLAEETGLINQMGYWVIREASRQLRLWQRELARPDLSVTVNLSARQFNQPDLDHQILAIVRQEQLDPASLKLEITESLLMEQRATVMGLIQGLKNAGFDLYLDDFGTGYSSLNYLHIFPIDNVKIDRSFVSRIEQPGKEREIVRSIVLLAENLGLGVIAEGVETKEQLDVLGSMNCNWAQGFYFSKPLAAEGATELLTAEYR